MVDIPSEVALQFIKQLEEAVANKDGEELSNLVFDADCDGLDKEIDLVWYEQKAVRLNEANELWKLINAHK